jgi:hypothetical protein
MTPANSCTALDIGFPDWVIRQSEAGRWWARRSSPLGGPELRAGCRMTLDADDLNGLVELLTKEGDKCIAAAR